MNTPELATTGHLRPFTPTDWMGFAGAERFPDGSEPLIGETNLSGTGALVILDARGVDVYPDPEEGGSWYSLVGFPPATARLVAESIIPATTPERLEALGFTYVS